jgi:hypothetical protein
VSKFINVVAEINRENTRKPITTQYALIYVTAEAGDKFTEAMQRLPDSYEGQLIVNVNGFLIGWLAYTARGANITDITRRVDPAGGVALPIARVINWDAE